MTVENELKLAVFNFVNTGLWVPSGVKRELGLRKRKGGKLTNPPIRITP